MTSLMERSRILKFSASMLAAVLLAEGILFMATELLGLFYLFSAAIAMEAAVLFVFFLNDVWTFGDTENTRSVYMELSDEHTLELVPGWPGIGLIMGIAY